MDDVLTSNGFAGIHHLALCTKDLDRTLRFYREVVGLEGSAAALRARVEAENITVRDFADLGTFAFADPNGGMVEIVSADQQPGGGVTLARHCRASAQPVAGPLLVVRSPIRSRRCCRRGPAARRCGRRRRAR